MVALQSFSVVIFLSTLSSGRTDTNRSWALFLPNDTFDVNEEKPHPSGSASKSDYNISPKLTHPISDSRLDSPRNTKIRLSLCCPFGEARNQGSCVTDNATTEIVPRIGIRINDYVDQIEVSKRNFDLLHADPCDFDWMVPSELNNFELENGFMRNADFDAGLLYDVEHYCLFRNPEAVEYSARVCEQLIEISSWKCFCAIVVILILLAVFAVYSVIPEHRNLHGMMFRSYIGTYGFAALGVLAWWFTTELRSNANFHRFSDITVRYCAGSCACWLNAMSFTIWRSFRGLRSVDFHTRECEKRKYIAYAIYAWGSPVVALTAILLPIYYLPYLRNEVLGYTVKLWSCVGAIGIFYIANTFLFISTALAIRNQKMDTARLINNMNKHHEVAEQWFNLHVKLFVLMGGHIMMWIIWLVCPGLTTSNIFGMTELIQAMFIFAIFIWKDDVKQSFCRRIAEIVKVPSWKRMPRSSPDPGDPRNHVCVDIREKISTSSRNEKAQGSLTRF